MTRQNAGWILLLLFLCVTAAMLVDYVVKGLYVP
jgi:hypothetical protein